MGQGGGGDKPAYVVQRRDYLEACLANEHPDIRRAVLGEIASIAEDPLNPDGVHVDEWPSPERPNRYWARLTGHWNLLFRLSQPSPERFGRGIIYPEVLIKVLDGEPPGDN